MCIYVRVEMSALFQFVGKYVGKYKRCIQNAGVPCRPVMSHPFLKLDQVYAGIVDLLGFIITGL